MPIEDSDPRVIAREKRRASKERKKQQQNVQFRGFINATPSEADKENFAGWMEDPENLAAELENACLEGWKITVTYETNGDYFRSTAAVWDAKHPSAGLVLSLRAGSAAKALARCIWWLSWKCAYQLEAAGQDAYDQDAW